jgi:hypothetical protein
LIFKFGNMRREDDKILKWTVVSIPWISSALNFSAGKLDLLVMVAERSKDVLSSLGRKPGSWVRILHKAWMFSMCMCLFCVCVVLCLGIGLSTSWSLVQGVLQSVKWSWNWKIRGQGPRGLYSQWKSWLVIALYLNCVTIWKLCLNYKGYSIRWDGKIVVDNIYTEAITPCFKVQFSED